MVALRSARSEQISEQFDDAIRRVAVHVDFAKITVTPSGSAVTSFDSEMKASRQLPELSWSVDAGTLTLTLDSEGCSRVDSKIMLHVPDGIELIVESQAGSIRVSDIEATKITVESQAGTIRMRDVRSAIKIESQAGSVRLNDIVGDVDIESMAGSIRVHDVEGSMFVSSQAGSVRLGGVRGERLRITTQAGSVKLDELSVRNAELEGQMGNIRAVFVDRPHKVGLSTQLGKAYVVVPAGRYAITSSGKCEVVGAVVHDAAADSRISISTTLGKAVVAAPN